MIAFQIRAIERLILLILVVVLLGACATTSPNRPLTMPEVASVPVVVHPKPEIKHEGSLWRENGPFIGLFTNYTARVVGDIVTVRIVESATATNKAATTTNKDSTFSAGIDGFFNAEKRFPATQPFFNPFSKVAGNLVSDFEGEGTTSRSGNLSAVITARVVEVLPGGDLRISGSRQIWINNEEQAIILSGIIRPEDISSKNEILSSYIADARISYQGSGILSDRQKPGWFTRTMDTVWPF